MIVLSFFIFFLIFLKLRPSYLLYFIVAHKLVTNLTLSVHQVYNNLQIGKKHVNSISVFF